LVCFRLRAADPLNERLLRQVNATGQAYLTHTKVDGRYVLRLAVGAPSTEERHVAATWKLIQAAAEDVLTGSR
jgi:aromatic-L-amino-acid/L-tryptophan decarboxylase